MNGKELFELLNDIDDDIVRETSEDMLFWKKSQEGVSVRAEYSPKKLRRTVIASVACVAAAVCGVFVMVLNIARIRTNDTTTSPSAGSGQNSVYADVLAQPSEIGSGARFENHLFDDRADRIMSLGLSVNGDYLYAEGERSIKVDTRSGEVYLLCAVVGCEHETGSPECAASKYRTHWLSSPDGMYYVSENKLCLFDGKEDRVILQNNFCTEYEKEIRPDDPCGIHNVVYNDGLFYLAGGTFYFTYDPSSGEVSEPVVIADRSIAWRFEVGGGNIYYVTDTEEAYIYNIASGERKKLGDDISTIDHVNGVLYYVQYEDEVPMLYAADSDGGNAEKLLQDCWVNFAVTEDRIYWQNYVDTDYTLYVSALDGSDTKELVFPNDENGGEYQIGQAFIITSGATDKVFIIADAGLFVFDGGSDTGRFIALGEDGKYRSEEGMELQF